MTRKPKPAALKGKPAAESISRSAEDILMEYDPEYCLPEIAPLPDWWCAEAYPKANDEFTPRQWAWEFLRRSPDYDYRVFWMHLFMGKHTHEAREEHSKKLSPRCLQQLRGGGGVFKGDFYIGDIGFGLAQPLDPGISAKELGCAPPFIIPQAQVYRGPGRIREFTLTHDQAVLVINTALPRDAQFEQAKSLLPPQKFRLRRNEYPMYLRVLDARSAGVRQNKMAEELEISKVTVRNHLRAADELCAGGYWRLLASGK